MTSLDADRFASRANWLGRSLRWPLDRLPKEMAMPILSGPLLARRWIVGAGIHECWLGTHERGKQRAILSHLQRDMVACDIGANAGFYSLLMARAVGKEGLVYAFEPQPDNLNYLRRHLQLNGIRNVLASGEAVADFVGDARFAPNFRGYEERLSDGGQLRAPVVTLDHLFAIGRLQPADLVRIDAGGAEVGVLKGAQKFLKRFRPVVFLTTRGEEVYQHSCKLLKAVGYRLSSFDGSSDAKGVCEVVASTR